MAHWLKPLLGIPATHAGVPVLVLVTLVLIQLSADVSWEAADDDSSLWANATPEGRQKWNPRL